MHRRLIEFLEEKSIAGSLGSEKFLSKTCHFNFARKYSESIRWRTICMWNIYRPQKSSDTVSHHILLEKLNHHGIRVSQMVDSGPI